MLHRSLPLAAVLSLALAATAEERVLCSMPEGGALHSSGGPAVAFAKDGSRVAFVMRRGPKGREVFVPVTSSAKQAGEVEVGDEFEGAARPAVSDDGSRVAFSVGEGLGRPGQTWRLLVDGKLYVKEDWIGTPYFWPDSTDLIYWTQPEVKVHSDWETGGDYVLRVNKKPGEEWANARAFEPPSFSGDGKRAAFFAGSATETGLLMVTRQSQKHSYDKLGLPGKLALNHNGKEWALEVSGLREVVRDGSKTNVLSAWIRRGDDEVGLGFESAERPTFAPTGDRLACRVVEDDKYGAWIEGGRDPECVFDAVTELAWELGRAKREGLAFVAYVVEPGQGGAADRKRWFARCLDSKGKLLDGGVEWDAVRHVAFGPEGLAARDLVYTAKDGDGWHLVREREVKGSVEVTKSAAFDFIAAPVVADGQIAAGGQRGADFIWITLD